VIINITGGPDLSLVEVSEASSIVQQAADEDANIIFGAVVDPALKGKVKITVIATGFGAPAGTHSRLPQAPGMTPIDMTAYADAARAKAAQQPAPAVPIAPAAPAASAIQIAPVISTGGRRVAFDLPFSNPATPAPATDQDFDLNLDVPAFLRRQEG